jgi:cytoskeletal protein RodZ
MKKIFKNKLVLLGLAVLVVGGIGFVLVKGVKKTEAPTPETKTEEPKTKETPDVKSNEPNNNPQTSAPSPTPTPVTNSNIGTINDVTLTVYMNAQATTSLDGKTTVPAGSLSPYFYVPSGVYSIQKLSNGKWIDVASNINYEGHGGIAAAAAGPAEDNISYRVLRLENGTAKDISKTFVVKRSDLSGGVKTYN